ncbi:hypothetical protein Peur_027140 [Populus x canadensis]
MDLVMVALHQTHYVRKFYDVLLGIACRPLMHPTIRKSMILVHVTGDRWVPKRRRSPLKAKSLVSRGTARSNQHLKASKQAPGEASNQGSNYLPRSLQILRKKMWATQ